MQDSRPEKLSPEKLAQEYSFQRYLAAKKSVDDRALNGHTWSTLAELLLPAAPGRPLEILEIGAGIGTMAERMLESRLLASARYTALDAQAENIACALARLPRWGSRQGFEIRAPVGGPIHLERSGQAVTLTFEAADVFDFVTRVGGRQWDLLLAHAFLDLVDIPSALPQLFSLLRPGGLFYFTLNFDGATLLQPQLDAGLDELIQALYHRTMDERITGGCPSGDSRAGRHLFTHLRQAGAQILAAGASDWVVFGGPHGYPEDEAYFLHFILHTIHSALHGHPQLEPGRFDAWLAERHAQVERAELTYIAHQLDFVGRVDDPIPQALLPAPGEAEA